mmetsp:Transcript_33033/g.60572  ORF Transcript_33033/g.60572 Transcript_33033/m.60572 type:complete len:273 (-) Transcript_33033:59-877(-)
MLPAVTQIDDDVTVQKTVIVLLDADRSLGRPLCSEVELRHMLTAEVLEQVEASAAWAPWSFFTTSAEQRRDEIKQGVAVAIERALSGSDPVPKPLPRIIEAVVRELMQNHADRASCMLFGDADNDSVTWDPILPGGMPAEQALSAWYAVGSASGVPNLRHVCASGELYGASSVVVVTARAIPSVSLLAGSCQFLSPFFWVHCTEHTPDEFEGIVRLCIGSGGTASTVHDVDTLSLALQLAISDAPPPVAKSSDSLTSLLPEGFRQEPLEGMQ